MTYNPAIEAEAGTFPRTSSARVPFAGTLAPAREWSRAPIESPLHRPTPIAPVQKKQKLRLSVAMCTYNGATHLARQLDSIAAQTRLPDELTVFDDRSRDDTLSILNSFAARAPFEVRVKINSTNLGSTKNFESAIAAADGDVITLSDQDDIWYPHKLAAIEAEFNRPENPGLVFSDADVVDANLLPLGYRLWSTVRFNRREQARFAAGDGVGVLLKSNVVTGATLAFAARHRDLILPIPAHWIHDGWVAMLVSAVDRCRMIPEPLLAYRQHSGQQIGGRRLTLLEQWEIARQMDRIYFDRLEANYAAADERLRRGPAPVSAGVLRQTLEKARHCRSRAVMRRSPISRPGLILMEVARRRYERYSLGWKSLAQDMFL